MNTSDVLLGFAKKLSDDDLSYLRARYKQNFSGDMADIANFLAREEEVDECLRATTSAEEWFLMVDRIGDLIESEYKRRFESLARS